VRFSLIVSGLLLWGLAVPLVVQAEGSQSSDHAYQSRDTETCIYRGCGRRDKV
jgi:hypothetical protein